uniref:Uncharacterized protein n=1 Tax=Arundo donax TaxID=35708 RepID=A0A0A9GUV1_ARUDO
MNAYNMLPQNHQKVVKDSLSARSLQHCRHLREETFPLKRNLWSHMISRQPQGVIMFYHVQVIYLKRKRRE